MMRVGGNNPASRLSGGNAFGAAGIDAGSGVFVPRTLAVAIVIAISYYAGVHVGLATFTFEPNAISILWPPNAILLAALLLTPPRTWWLLIAAVFPAHLIAELSLGVPLTMTLCWFLSNVAEALLGAAIMVRYLGGPPHFDRIRDVSVFLIVGVVLAPAASSFLDVAFVALVGWRYTGEYWPLWRMRLFSNALATLTLVPLIVIWVRRGIQLRQASLAEYAEVAALLTGVCVTATMVFQQSHAPGESAMLMYAPLPFLMWAAVRRGVSGVSLCLIIVTMLAITGVLRDRGPFTYGAPESAALAVQVFLVIAASSLMLLAASLAELAHARAVALRQKESLNLALGAAQMGTWDWDIAGDRITWRVGQEGTATREIPGSSQSIDELLDRVHADDRAMVRRALNDALEQRESGEVECRFLCGDAGVRWITGKGKVLVDARGKPQRMIGVHIDTTQRKSQEMQERAQLSQLAHLSRVSILGELSGALAHELNQPLAAILTNAQAALLGMDGPSPDLREIAEILTDIVEDDHRAAEVIRRLRTLFMRGAVQMQRVDANECIREVLALEHSDLITRNVAIDVRLARGLPAVMADRVQLQQVLLNLIVNACDAMAANETGDRRLRIVSASNGDGGVEIEISDSGPGVENPEKIFEPFFSTKDHGVGLGLAICRTIIAAHRGRLWASNNATGGATLHISMPARSDGSFEFSGADSRGISVQ